MMRRKGVIINGNVIIAIDELLKRLLANNPNTNLSLLESLALEQFKSAVIIANYDDMFVNAILECIEEDKQIERTENGDV